MKRIKMGSSFQFKKIKISRVTVELDGLDGNDQDFTYIVTTKKGGDTEEYVLLTGDVGIGKVEINGRVFNRSGFEVIDANNERRVVELTDKVFAAMQDVNIIEFDVLEVNGIEYPKGEWDSLELALKSRIIVELVYKIARVGIQQDEAMHTLIFCMLFIPLAILSFIWHVLAEELSIIGIAVLLGVLYFVGRFLASVLNRLIARIRYLKN